ncbi:MAG: hypothetical protein WCL54_03910 [Clostridia bacterium]
MEIKNRSRYYFWLGIVVFLLVASSLVWKFDLFGWNQNSISVTEQNLNILLKARSFSPIDDAKKSTKEVNAFKALLNSENAKNIFTQIEKGGTKFGKLYALCGLYYFDRELYNAEIKKLAKSKETILEFRSWAEPKDYTRLNEVIKSSHEKLDFYYGGIPRMLIDYFQQKYIVENLPIDVKEIRYDSKAYNILKEARMFSGNPRDNLGNGATRTDEIDSFAVLFNNPHAEYLFRKLEKEATMHGKLFALCALYYLDNDYFKKVVEKYASRKEIIKGQIGCTYSWKKSVKNMTKDIKNGVLPHAIRDYLLHANRNIHLIRPMELQFNPVHWGRISKNPFK